jgi:hypothetical protein
MNQLRRAKQLTMPARLAILCGSATARGRRHLEVIQLNSKFGL